MVKKNFCCRDCGHRFRHWRHLMDHQFDTGHNLVHLKRMAKAFARVARVSRDTAKALRQFGVSGHITRNKILAAFRVHGICIRKKVRC